MMGAPLFRGSCKGGPLDGCELACCHSHLTVASGRYVWVAVQRGVSWWRWDVTL